MPLRSCLVALFLFALAAGPCEPPSELARGEDPGAAIPTRPNVVLIVADDLGYFDSDLFDEHPLHETPNLDRLAARGCRFANCYAVAPVCSPNRAAYLTGLHPVTTGITNASGHKAEAILDPYAKASGPATHRAAGVQSATRLKLGFETLAETLAAHGYACGHVGKWHLGRDPYVPTNQGFASDVPQTFAAGPPGGYLGWSTATMTPDPPEEHIEDRMGIEAARFIQANRDRPFFLQYAQFSVHAPYEAKPNLLAKYEPLAATLAAEEGLALSPTYAAMVQSLDGNVGRILNAIEANGVAGRTVVVFVSDNGGASHNQVDGGAATSNAPLRGGKGTLWNGGLRVPLVVAWPGVSTPGSTSSELAGACDVYSTILDATGAVPASPRARDGLSLRPAMTGEGLARSRLFFHYPHETNVADSGGSSSAVVTACGWKLVRTWHGEGPDVHLRRLFDLAADPGETVDLAAERPDLVAELDASLEAFLSARGAVVPPANPLFDPDAE